MLEPREERVDLRIPAIRRNKSAVSAVAPGTRAARPILRQVGCAEINRVQIEHADSP
jgi:hypothetical protein